MDDVFGGLQDPWLIEAKYDNRLSGGDVRLFFRGYDPVQERWRSSFITSQEGMRIPSGYMKLEDALKIQKQVTFPTQISRIGNGAVLTAKVDDKKRRKELKELDIPKSTFSDLSPSEFLHSIYRPFGKLRINPNIDGPNFLTDEPISLDILLDELFLIIDIETENWEDPTKENKISLIVITPSDPDLESLVLSAYEPPEGANAEYIPTQGGFADRVKEIIDEYDPLGIVGYNLHYDIIQYLRTIGEKHNGFGIGVDGSRPRVRSAAGKTKSLSIAGREVHDLYLLAGFDGQHLLSQKLDQFYEYIIRKDHKRFNYFELIHALKNNDPDAYKYVLEDGEKTRNLFNAVKKQLFTDGLALRMPPESFQKSFGNSADMAHERNFFVRTKTKPFIRRYRRDQLPFRKKEDNAGKKAEDDEGLLGFNRQNTYREASLVFPLIFNKVFGHFLSEDYKKFYRPPYDENDLFNAAKRIKELSYRLFAAFFQAQADLKKEHKNVEYWFRRNYGLDYHRLEERLNEHLERWNQAVSHDDIINSGNLYLLTPEAAERVADQKLGLILSTSHAISYEKQVVIRGKPLYSQGARFFTKLKPKWAWNLLTDVCVAACDGRPEDISDIIAGAKEEINPENLFELLMNRRVDGEQYIYGYQNNGEVAMNEFINPDPYVYMAKFMEWYPIVPFLLSQI